MTHDTFALRSALLKTLADGQFHSGQALAETFNLSRTSIANHISAIADLGIEIFSVKGKGYRLSSEVELLSIEKIQTHNPSIEKISLEILNIIDSTNTYIKQNIDNLSHGHTVVAEAQTAGRGRRGRTWVSPFASSLYLSLCWRFQGGYQQIGGLSLFVGYCVIEALQAIGVDGLAVKWPNDIYRHGKKLGGILVEVEGQIGTEVASIIGAGVNIKLPENIDSIDQPFSDLSELGIERNFLCAKIIEKLHDALPVFEVNGLTHIVDKWNALDVFASKRVSVSGSQETIQGISKGINAQGALLLDTENGLKTIHGGEVSLRAN